MSEPITALAGAASETGIARITELPLQGMITLRGDLASSAVQKAASGVAEVEMPGPNHANCVEDRGICWMSPDELLILCPYDMVAANIDKMTETLGNAHSLAVNVSDARAAFRITGPQAREVLAKLCPVDLSPENFAPGMFRRTRMAQVPAAFWMTDAESFQLVCFRSQARYVFDLLSIAAQPGSGVKIYLT
ncbi:sarcosine oxidase subunit gamma [uncultured Roseobacter sp.]|uniref:sarcosine oxidase subunit gamma n=1 Tax=uncultured Roseobacter sp. TaxID=114847 RepID=UPI00261A1A30|nr:sarcosine oxidase subunit gamma family protein [uncultured Roseobacter sp.]